MYAGAREWRGRGGQENDGARRRKLDRGAWMGWRIEWQENGWAGEWVGRRMGGQENGRARE